MSDSLAAAFYADQALHESVEVVENVPLARDTFRLRLACPEIARRIVPGQFVMLRLGEGDDPLLGRPLALYDTFINEAGEPVGVDIVYLVVGRLTRILAQRQPGQRLEIWGPLGNGFTPAAADHLIMVAGGIGQTPFVALARQQLGLRTYGEPPHEVTSTPKVTLCYGARSEEYLAGVDDFRQLGVEVHISTDDGSAGYHGLVTDLLTKNLAGQGGSPRIVCCGPEPMMEAVSKIATATKVPCQVSLETPMACGIGICFSCVARVRQPDGEWDYKRTCVEGPVFDSSAIVW